MKNLFTTLIFSLITSYAYAQIDIIHPPNWWVGFETQNLQLLVKGNNINEYEVGIESVSYTHLTLPTTPYV